MTGMGRATLLVLVALFGCCRATEQRSVALRCLQVVRDFATVVRGEPGDKEAHAEALHVLSSRLKRLKTSDETAELVDETVDTLRKMRDCDSSGGRVGKW